MKKNDLLLLSSVALYSYLFYQQSAGINFPLFTISLILILILKNGIYKNLFNLTWWAAIAGSIVSSICILLYGNTLSVIANILSISLVAAFSVEKNSSLLLAGLYSLYSYVGSAAFMFVDWAKKQKRKTENVAKKGFKFFMLIIPFVVSLVFFFLYREANPLFKNFTATISFDFITWSWICFTLSGFILLYGFFYHRSIPFLLSRDLRAQNTLFSQNFSEEKNTLWGFKLELANELTTGIVLFSLLNVLLLFVNALDFQYVWLNSSLPEGLNFSEAVHQGIGTLITSIILAVLIILIYFRGNLNFYSSGKTIKILAYLWVLQNAFMVVSTVMRNQLYIQQYSLTYKRIGVYVYLLLCLIGLFTALIKIAAAKSNWYLFRANGWLFYSVLIISAVFNWDRIISEFNLSNSKTLDREYLIQLSTSNIDQLLTSFPSDPNSKEIERYTLNSLHNKTFNFLKFYHEKEWKSWNLEDETVYNSVMKIQADSARAALILTSNGIRSLSPVFAFKQITNLDVSSNPFNNLEELASFPELKELHLDNNNLENIQKIPELKKLTSLSIFQNSIQEFYALRNLPKLKSLDISYNSCENLNSLPELNDLTQLNISGNKTGHLSVLKRFPNLQKLRMNSINKYELETLPSLPGLAELEICNMSLSGSDEKVICAISELSGLKHLKISSNQLQNLYLIPQELFEVRKKTEGLATVLTKVPLSLETLIISNNNITTLDGIENLVHLTELDITANEIADISKVEKCPGLKSLSLSANKIGKINPLASLNTLQSLYLDHNAIYDINSLKSLHQLEYLNLSSNQIFNISSLSELKKLSFLNIANNYEVKDLKALQNLTNLTELSISNCQVKDLSPLYKLKKLKILYCYGIEKSALETLRLHLPELEINDELLAEPVYSY